MASKGISRLQAGKNIRLLRGGSQYRICVDLPPSRSGRQDFSHPFKVTEDQGALSVAAGDVVFQFDNDEVRKSIPVSTVSALSLAAGTYDLFLGVRGSDAEASAVYFFKSADTGTMALDLPGLRALRIARIVIALDANSTRTYTISQVRFDHAYISVKLEKMPFAVTFSASLPSAGSLITGWSVITPITATVSAGSIAYTARGQDLACSGGSLTAVSGALRMKVLESIYRSGSEASVSRAALGGPVLAFEAGKTDDYEVDVDSSSTSIAVQHWYTLGIFTAADNNTYSPPKWVLKNCGTVTMGGYVPDSWYHEEASESSGSGSSTTVVTGTTPYILKANGEGGCEAWSSFSSYSSGAAGSSGTLIILNSHWSDPVQAGDVMIGFLADGVTDYSDGTNTWSYTEQGDGSGSVLKLWKNGSNMIYYQGGTWYMGSDFGGANVGSDYFTAVTSGYNGNTYYKNGSWYLWGASGSRVLSKALGGGCETTDEWYYEASGTLVHQGTATADKTLAVGHKGLQCSGASGTPPTLGSWSACDLGAGGLTAGTITLSPSIRSGVFYTDKRSFN